MAKVTGCRLHIVHVACKEGVEEVMKAREEGVDVTCEPACTTFTLRPKSWMILGLS